MTVRVLFVCLGNICRSPMAEAVFQQKVDAAGLSNRFKIDSAGTGSWHVGERAHRGTRRVLADNGIDYGGRARTVRQQDLDDETYVVAMDAANVHELKRRYGDIPRLYRLLDFAPDVPVNDVPDPYYEGNFEAVYDLVDEGCQGLLDMLVSREELQK